MKALLTSIALWLPGFLINSATAQTADTSTLAAEVLQSDSNFSKYKLRTISSVDEYRQLVSRDPNQVLVPLSTVIPKIRLDIRYATSNNLMNMPMYNKPAAYLRRAPAKALKAAEKKLNRKGYALKIYDAYRPYAVTVKFYEKFLDSVFVASPYTGSRHNRGCAVDLTLVDLQTGGEIKMPTRYDTFSEAAAADYQHSDSEAVRNRTILQEAMIQEGFSVYPSEWWHFDFNGWEKYAIMDLSFENLERSNVKIP
jgi:zinc D-Ala-D-Ala dipeptidase